MSDLKFKQLMKAILQLLTSYEVELTAYRSVCAMLENEAKRLGSTMDMSVIVQSLISDVSLRAIAGSKFAECSRTTETWTSGNLDPAIDEVLRELSLREQSSRPDLPPR
jgi:hypothetical protein